MPNSVLTCCGVFWVRRRKRLPWAWTSSGQRFLVGRFQVIVGPLGHEPCEFACGVLEFLLELGGDQGRQRSLTQAFDEGVDAVQGGLEDIGQIWGMRVRVVEGIVAHGCQDECEVDRVVHGGVLSFGECIHPLLKERRRLLQASFARTPVQRGSNSWQNLAVSCHWRDRTPFICRVLHGGRPQTLHALFDAGAGKADADVRMLWDLVEHTPQVTVTVRACRYPHRLANWKCLPSGLFVSHEEAGTYAEAPATEIRLAATYTTLKGESAEEAVRTIVCREVVPGPKKDRWHPLFSTSEADPLTVLETYRLRQHHEQGYRVGVHDLFLNATPCGYDKESPDPRRPRFHRGPLQMMGWLMALVSSDNYFSLSATT